MAYGLLLLRLVIGLTMAGHGLQKLFGWFDGPGARGTEEMFRKLGFPAAAAVALVAGTAEAAGGLLLALGLLTPLAALCISVVMLNAIGSVHWKNGFWASKGGYEFNLALLAGSVAIVATGPGRLSLDRLIGWDDNISGLWWAVGVFAAAVILSVLTLATRHVEAPANEREERHA
jgi:putative oxidoreductase